MALQQAHNLKEYLKMQSVYRYLLQELWSVYSHRRNTISWSHDATDSYPKLQEKNN